MSAVLILEMKEACLSNLGVEDEDGDDEEWRIVLEDGRWKMNDER